MIINRVNLLDVYYGFYRESGKEYADNIMSGIEKSIVEIREFDMMEGKEDIRFRWIR